jgi:peptide deformylase
MAVHKILLYPKDKIALRAISDSINTLNHHTRRLIRDLKETLLSRSDGVGLAAPQINAHVRVIVVRLGARDDWDRDAGPPISLINPEIIESGEELKDLDGCLSFPGLYGETIRPHFLRVSAIAEDGKPFERIFSGFDAVVVHHEIDHLNGILFIDHIESLADLHRVYVDGSGKPVRVPISEVVPAIRLTDMPE